MPKPVKTRKPKPIKTEYSPPLELTVEQENELALQAKNGSKKAFDRLICAYRPFIFEYSKQLLGDTDGADEAVQNTLIYAWFHLSEYNPKGKFKFWLRDVVKHRVRRSYEDRLDSLDNWDDAATLSDLEIKDDCGLDSITRLDSPVNIATRHKMTIKIGPLSEEELNKLTPMERDVIRLYLDGFKTGIIASKMGTTRKAINAHIRRIRLKLDSAENTPAPTVPLLPQNPVARRPKKREVEPRMIIGMTSIYGLYDPETNELRYVGQTKQELSERLSGHLKDLHIDARTLWIAELASRGLKPIIKELDRVAFRDATNRENELILEMSKTNNLLNRMVYMPHGTAENYRERTWSNR